MLLAAVMALLPADRIAWLGTPDGAVDLMSVTSDTTECPWCPFLLGSQVPGTVNDLRRMDPAGESLP